MYLCNRYSNIIIVANISNDCKIIIKCQLFNINFIIILDSSITVKTKIEALNTYSLIKSINDNYIFVISITGSLYIY